MSIFRIEVILGETEANELGLKLQAQGFTVHYIKRHERVDWENNLDGGSDHAIEPPGEELYLVLASIG